MGEEMFTHNKYAPSDFVWWKITVVTGGTTKIIGRTFGKSHFHVYSHILFGIIIPNT